jgi:hypothetical protein
MFDSLSAFYNSDIWRKFRLSLIAERTNKEDGILYCEYSGEPIVNLYNAVAHHIKPLTMENVNDFAVSLNPSNIMLVTHKAHNEIHARFGHCTERKVYYIYGAPCGGKTTFVNSIKGNSDIVCDIDNIWQCITGGARYEKPNALKYNMFEIRNTILYMIKNRFPRTGGWERAFIIEGGAAKKPREDRIKELGAEPIFIDTDKETCLKRLANDTTRTQAQKAEWQNYINKWFEEYQA